MLSLWISFLVSFLVISTTFAIQHPTSSLPSVRSASPVTPPITSSLPVSELQVPLSSHQPSLPSSLPDSIRDFRFNAPSAPTSSLLSAPYGQPSVDDLVLSPLVLAVTVDGQIHALKRETGQWVWTLHDDGGASLGGPAVSPHDQLKRSQSAKVVGSPLVKAMGRQKAAATGGRASSANMSSPLSQNLDLGKVEEEDEDEVYVIEPSSGGDIFLFSRSRDDLGGASSLEKLPLSMQQLVELSPFTFPSHSSRMFMGRKETSLVGVDLRTGRLVGVFGSGAGWCEWDESRQGRVRTDEECDEEISRRPEDLLYMARTEYHVSIYAKSSSALLQTLSYTTYSSSSLGSALQEQWTRTPDDRYLQPTHDNMLLCFLTGVPGIQWAIEFDHPVVAIFDIALPSPDATGGRSADDETAQPLMFEQPHPQLSRGLPRDFEELQHLPEATFIGQIGDNLFAMSRDHFPFVALAPPNLDSAHPSSTSTTPNVPNPATDADSDDLPSVPVTAARCRGLQCLLGRHQLHRPNSAPLENRIDPPQDRLQLDPAPPSLPPLSTPSSPHPPNHSSDLASPLYRPLQKLSTFKTATLGTALLILLGYLSIRKLWTPKTTIELEKRVRKSLSFSLGSRESSAESDGIRANGSTKHLDASLPPTPLSGSRPATPAEDYLSLVERSSPSTCRSITSKQLSPDLSLPLPLPLWSEPLPTPDYSTNTTPDPSLLSSPFSTASPSSSPMISRTRSTSLSTPPFLDTKELPPIPPPLQGGIGIADEGGDGESDGEMREGAPRKKSRRRRGKKPKKSQPKATEDMTDGLEKELINLTLNEGDTKEEVMDGSEATQSENQIIGGLCVSETILGYGSHGTVVLRGEFQGRAVAVKRLLKDFVTLATHEVALLQESDDHPHVIRYFCKEQRDTFLYIALELCPASLYDLIDQPSAYPDLVRDLDSKRALRQITSGLRHLHRLKIVHRDIKPQNILVSQGKHGSVRMLISDFGLCKKLDMDESSFQQTVNHAAGSFGYRAPEVLRGQVDPNAGASGSPSNGTADSRNGNGNSSVGSGIMTDPSMRLTRSIDIFSLGCIFYYVLTGGEHPFGGRYEREMNILNGKLSLDRLDGLGDEALEVQDLVTRMVATDPRERPAADAVLLHPFFWNAQKRLLFLCDASDRFEIMERDPPDPSLVSLEQGSASVVGDDWQLAIDNSLLENLGKYRKYDGKSVRDLLRVLRNKKHHYQDLPDGVRRNLGDLPGGFLSYFTTRFPRLLLHVYDTVALYLSDEPMFATTFHISDDDA